MKPIRTTPSNFTSNKKVYSVGVGKVLSKLESIYVRYTAFLDVSVAR